MSTVVAEQLPASITGKFNIALAQSKFQTLQSKADSLVYNEDNLQEIADFLKSLRGVKKAIDETHKEGKAEALKIGRQWDSAKNTFTEQVVAIEERPQAEYSRICSEIEDRRINAEQENQRVISIQNGIEQNAINFANQIAAATTSERLSEIERVVNLEKGRKEKYQEFLPQAVERFTQLNGLLASQKVTVKGLEEIKRQEEEAAKQQNEELMIKLQQQREEAEAKVEEQKIQVQEKVIEQSVNTQVQVAEEILPTIKARNTRWNFELVNEKEAMKKSPELLLVSLNDEKVKDVLKTLKSTNQLEGKKEYILNGIRFFEIKTY